jgi:hypothetical protein
MSRAKENEPEVDASLAVSPEGVPSGSLKLRLGKLLDSIFSDRQTERETVAALAASATKKTTKGIPLSGAETAALLAQLGPTLKRAERVAQRLKRTESIFSDAKLLPGFPIPTEPQPPTGPFVDRWRQGAGLDSEEHVQEMWSRILAGQMRKPGRFSLQTLAVLPELDDEIARKLVALGAFAGNDEWVPSWRTFTKGYDDAGLPYQSFLRFDASRLLHFVDSAITLPEPTDFRLAGRSWRVWPRDARENFLPVQLLTPAGSDLLSLADRVYPVGCVKVVGTWLDNYCSQVLIKTREGFVPWERGGDPRS